MVSPVYPVPPTPASFERLHAHRPFDGITELSKLTGLNSGTEKLSRHAGCFAINAIAFGNNTRPGIWCGHGDAPDGCGNGTRSNLCPANSVGNACPTTSSSFPQI